MATGLGQRSAPPPLPQATADIRQVSRTSAQTSRPHMAFRRHAFHENYDKLKINELTDYSQNISNQFRIDYP